jgi:hypothetical protein
MQRDGMPITHSDLTTSGRTGSTHQFTLVVVETASRRATRRPRQEIHRMVWLRARVRVTEVEHGQRGGGDFRAAALG